MSEETHKTNFEQRDPLGEIRHFAKQLWADSGKPDGTSWKDYFAEAEDMLMRGRGHAPAGTARGDSSPRRARYDLAFETRKPLEDIPEAILECMDNPENEVLSVLASAFRNYLTEHESLCLYRLLSENLIDLPGWNVCGPLSLEEIAEILAGLSGEYSESFLERCGNKNHEAIQQELKVAYWCDRLQSLQREDRPLNFHDRNTISRLKYLIEEEPRVLAVTLMEPIEECS